MPKAIWKNVILAESDDTTLLEGDHYFPPEAVNRQYLKKSNKQVVCSWKGSARYFHVVVEGEVNSNAAFCYPDPSKAAESIKGHIAFTNDVEIIP